MIKLSIYSPTENIEFKDFSRLLRDFPVLMKADLIIKDFSRKPSKFKYFSSLCEPLFKPSILFLGHQQNVGSDQVLHRLLIGCTFKI